ERILEVLSRERMNHDGFVVLVRGEHMIRAAAATEFMLQGFGKPVIFTGSRYSPQAVAYQDIRRIVKMGGLGLRSNLINAAQIAVSDDFPATAIMYGNKIIKPTHAVVNDFQAMNLYRSVDDEYLGKIDFGISLNRKKIAPATTEAMHVRFAPGVSFTESAYLGDDHALAEKSRKEKEPVLVLRLRQNETVPLERLEQLKARYRTVILFNPYYVLDHTGVVMLSRLTWPAAEMKVRWAHTIFPERSDFEKALSRDVIHESIQL
ncbi:MAG: asparaginase domain-containing protein, partial [Patescibacteria group bacterium]